MDFMSMKFSDVLFWYNRYELQITEEEVYRELSYDKKTGQEKEPPNALIIREIALSRIKKAKEKFKRLMSEPEKIQREIDIIRETLG
jgi:hypothetical protein